MLKIQNNVSAIVSQNDPKFIGDMISAKIYQKFKNTVGEMVSARIWGRFWCINYRLWQPWRNKIMVVGVLSLAPCYVGKSRYVELIRLHILVNCMELRWRQPCSDPVAPCKYKQVSCNCKTVRVKEVLHLFRCYTHTHIYIHLKNKREGFTRFQRNKNRGRYRLFGGGSHSQEQGYWPPFKGWSSDDKPFFRHTAPTWPHVGAFFVFRQRS